MGQDSASGMTTRAAGNDTAQPLSTWLDQPIANFSR